MNILILSPGRRVDIVHYFKTAFNKIGGKVFTADMSPYAPALYSGDEYFLLKKDFNNLNSYINDIITLCKNKQINVIITLIDPELVLLAENKEKFEKNGILPIVSSKKMIDLTFDKYLFYETFKEKLPLLETYNNVNEVKKAINENKLSYPIFAKIRNGSGSAGIGKIYTSEELETYVDKENFIFQPCVLKNEYGCDIYFDMKTGKIVSYFIKHKLNMRSGETDKSISIKNPKIKELILKLQGFDFFGPIDMDIFEDTKGNYYINEINPRFGGGYPHAYNAGINFIDKIITNLLNKENLQEFDNYKNGLVMMKYNGTLFIKDCDLVK